MESAESPGPMSLGSRLINVFAAPGELFAAVAAAPFSVANWLVPAALVAAIGLFANLVVFGQPALVQQIVAIQDREIDRAVEQGRIRAEDAPQVREAAQGLGMAVAKVAGGVAAVLAALLTPLWWGFLAWLVGRWVFRAPLTYLRSVEVAGLASLVAGLGTLVGLFLAVGLGRLMAGPHLGLLVADFDIGNRLHLTLGAINLFTLWHLALVALGVSRLIQRAFAPVALVLLGLWAGYKGVAVILGWVQFAL